MLLSWAVISELGGRVPWGWEPDLEGGEGTVDGWLSLMSLTRHDKAVLGVLKN